MHPEVPLLDIPVVKHPKEMSGQDEHAKKEEELRVQRVKDQQALVKGLRLAFEEGDAAENGGSFAWKHCFHCS
eukprot:g31741.t1